MKFGIKNAAAESITLKIEDVLKHNIFSEITLFSNTYDKALSFGTGVKLVQTKKCA
jgi:hypothetical protein